ncbi:MAG: prevent-host-death family protein [Ignavibacteria bacterium CG_4_8_14_3_um_filter_37_9]|nr:MAG: hypothetical protein AUJ54_07970 [Ignavibacteria bacterium CG1_02_37_35]PIW99566.1 MAG: prevent-host-death family protein [Ignavibacteria bacterium CG_4_8_14_3_um_filter_37_9]PIX93265.1 MAG: prevent-host-death family protein [Ignavibacteria bacterium CG_4_10_14_3_um_filter_37_18]
MYNIQIDQDIQPLSEFRSKVAFYFDKIKKNKRPLVITQNGKGAAVLLNVSTYQAMVNKIELLEDIKLAEEQIAGGKEITHHTVKQKFAKKG